MNKASWRARCIAAYLPLFYPFPKNDEWWGKGFTEWNLVRDAKSLFPGHKQPLIPALGYYSPLDAETRRAQAKLAMEHGVEAFCYWHMWFGDGRMLLHEPLEETMRSGVPDMPFCVAWANQTWTRSWARARTHGEVLMEQRYPGEEDHRAHFRYLLPMFKDSRYLKVEGKPVFSVYRAADLPDMNGFKKLWNELAQKEGFPGIFFVGMFNGQTHVPNELHIDGFTRNHPSTCLLRYARASVRWALLGNIGPLFRCLRGLLRHPQVFDHRDITRAGLSHRLQKNEFPRIISNWDDTPRHAKGGTVFTHSSPELFGSAIKDAVTQLEKLQPPERRLLFVQSWNEWGEGNHIEPDTETGLGYLQTLRNELLKT